MATVNVKVPQAVPEERDWLTDAELDNMERQWHRMDGDPYHPSKPQDLKLIQEVRYRRSLSPASVAVPEERQYTDADYLALRAQMLKEVDFWQAEHAKVAAQLRSLSPASTEPREKHLFSERQTKEKP